MAPQEALYGQRCKSQICWDDTDDQKVLSSDIIVEVIEKNQIICHRLRTAQSRQKSCSDMRIWVLEFKVRDSDYTKMSLMKRVTRFGKYGKLSPTYMGHFKILG